MPSCTATDAALDEAARTVTDGEDGPELAALAVTPDGLAFDLVDGESRYRLEAPRPDTTCARATIKGCRPCTTPAGTRSTSPR